MSIKIKNKEDEDLFMLVQDLVRKSFGDDFFCNLLMDDYPISLDYPYDVSTGLGDGFAGTFQDMRGEELVLYSKEYVAAGKTYAKLYKEATGRDVSLSLKVPARDVRFKERLEKILVD